MKRAIASLAVILSLVAVINMAAGCTPSQSGIVTSQQTSAGAATVPAGTSEATALPTNLPIVKEPVALSYWLTLNANVSASRASLADTELAKELEKRTGVRINYIHPAATSNAADAFSLMLASGSLPDMIYWSWIPGYPGGPEKAIQDNVIIPLNDLIDKDAVNLKSYLAVHPDIDRMIKTDSGSYYAFPYIRGDKWLCTYFGLIVRKDWLDGENLAIPQTIDDWTNMLRTFKSKKCDIPFTITPGALVNGVFSGAYGIVPMFFVKDGVVRYGPAEQAYRDYLMLLKGWFDERLLDPDFATQTAAVMTEKVTGSRVGAGAGTCVGGLGTWLGVLKQNEPNADLVGAPYPTLVKGDKPSFGQMEYQYSGISSVGITPQCKEKDVAAQWLDYAYGQEGSMLYNFGIENVSYTLDAGGNPKYTDIIFHNPDKLTPFNALAVYAMSCYSGPFIQDKREYEQILTYPEQVAAIDTWSQPDNGGWLPPVTLTKEESTAYAEKYVNISSYVDEMFLKFVMGQEPLGNFSQYVETLSGMGLEDVLNIENAAYKRYLNR